MTAVSGASCKKPLISVVLATYNGIADSLLAAVDSILRQSHSELELIIVDDGSSEAQAVAAIRECAHKDSRVRIIHHNQNAGVAAARNTALQQVAGEFTALMDDDDISCGNRLQQQLGFLLNHSNCAAVSCEHTSLHGSSIIKIARAEYAAVALRSPDNCHDFSSLTKCLVNSTSMIRTAALREVGGWRGFFRSAEDKDLTLRLEEKYTVARIPKVLYKVGRSHRKDNHDSASARNNSWRYRLAAVISAAYRRSGDKDPVQAATDIGQLLQSVQQQKVPHLCHNYLWRCLAGDARRYMRHGEFHLIDEQLLVLQNICGKSKQACMPLLGRLCWFAISTLHPNWFIHRLRHAN